MKKRFLIWDSPKQAIIMLVVVMKMKLQRKKKALDVKFINI